MWDLGYWTTKPDGRKVAHNWYMKDDQLLSYRNDVYYDGSCELSLFDQKQHLKLRKRVVGNKTRPGVKCQASLAMVGAATEAYSGVKFRVQDTLSN